MLHLVNLERIEMNPILKSLSVFRRMLFLILVSGLVLSIFSCRDSQKRAEVSAKVFTDKRYELMRTVRFRRDEISLSLFQPRNSSTNLPELIVLGDERSKRYETIHLYTNHASQHWVFEHERNTAKTTLFAKEFYDAVQHLGLNDKGNTAYFIWDELMISLLHCERLTAERPHLFKGLESVHAPKTEDDKLCWERMAKHEKVILPDISGTFLEKFYYLDEARHRIYCPDFSKRRNRQKMPDFRLRIYRLGCNVCPIYI